MIRTLRYTALALSLAGAAQAGLAEDLKLDDLFPKDRLLEVNITISKENWDTLRYQRRTRENALTPVSYTHLTLPTKA